MTTFNDMHKGTMTVSGNLTMNGAVTGDLHVLAGGKVRVNGRVAGRLIVDDGGSADITGVVEVGVVANGRVTVAVGAVVAERMLNDQGAFGPHAGASSISDSTPRFAYNADGTLSPS